MSEDNRWSYLAGYLHDGRPFQQLINPSWEDAGYNLLKSEYANRGTILIELHRKLDKEQALTLEKNVTAMLPSCNGTLKQVVEAEITRLLNG